MSESNSNAGKGLSIAGLVVGILSAILSFVPCMGMYAIYIGPVGLILAGVGFFQANKAGASKGMAIAGIVLSIAATGIAYWQYTKIQEGLNVLNEEFKKIDTNSLLDTTTIQ
jgi:hypothetical protein